MKDLTHILEKGVSDVIIKKELEAKLKSGKKLRVKLGIDPTGSDLHLGHMVPLRKMRQFQDDGHTAVLIFGNFTGQIGDPSGKAEARPLKTQQELEENAKHYLEQAAKVLDVANIEVRWNADWLGKLTFSDVTRLASVFTVQQMMERDMFQDRLKASAPIYVHEFMYPLMQGYDSVAIQADVELGGTDQTFNLLAGREIQRSYGQESQSVITVPILEGTDGVKKMGKTTGNYIGINEDPKDMYGKTMSIPDNLIVRYFELTTNLSVNEIHEINRQLLEQTENPRNLKMRLAREIVTIYHSAQAAQEAEQHFIQVFSKKELPDDIQEVRITGTSMIIIDILMQLNACPSKGEARRLIQGGGVKYNGTKIENFTDVLELTDDSILQVGKRQFYKLI
jgi:tyrosyl-tRNA synthetase